MRRAVQPRTGVDPGAGGLLSRELLIVTGKGGVGKTSVAAALALLGVQHGKRVLACELDAKGDLVQCIEGAGSAAPRQPSYDPAEVLAGLWVMSMDPEASLREYLRINLRIPLITRIGALSAAFDFVANAAPGVREIVTIGKVAFEVRERHYDIIVVDATATGHVVGLLRAPEAINELVGAGLIRGQTRWVLDILADPARTAVVPVTTAEETPVSETIELCDALAADTVVAVGAVVVNRVLPPLVDDRRRRALEAQLALPSAARARWMGTRRTAAVEALTASAHLGLALGDRCAEQIARLGAAMPGHTLLQLPDLFDSRPGLATTRRLAEALGEQR